MLHSLFIISLNCIHSLTMCCYTCVPQQRWSERAVLVHWRLISALTSFRNNVKFKPNKAGNVTVYTNYEPVHHKHNHAACCGTTMKPGAWVNQFHQDINMKSSKLWDVRRSLQVFKMTARHTFSQSPILQPSSKKPFKRRILCLQFEKISSKKKKMPEELRLHWNFLKKPTAK